jgi:hypothetical protein
VCLGSSAQLSIIVLNPENWRTGQTPADWQLKVNRGRPEIAACMDGDGSCLHLKSLKSSFALERGVEIDPYENRYLSWRWKVTSLPPGGDFRSTATDDQAAQVLVAFSDRHILTYIWDTTAPKGTMQSASSIPLVHIFAVVCESGPELANRWVPETRDIAADYERAFGKAASHVKGVRIQINSQHTGTRAESYIGEVVFRAKPQ